jgi:hypothetical protein
MFNNKLKIYFITILLTISFTNIKASSNPCKTNDKSIQVCFNKPKLFNVNQEAIETIINTTKLEIIEHCGCKTLFALFIFSVENKEFFENIFYTLLMSMENIMDELINYIENQKSVYKKEDEQVSIELYIEQLKILKKALIVKQRELINSIKKYYPIKDTEFPQNTNNLSDTNQKILKILNVKNFINNYLVKLKKYSKFFPSIIKNYSTENITEKILTIFNTNISRSFENNEQNIKKIHENIVKFMHSEPYKKLKGSYKRIINNIISSFDFTTFLNTDAVMLFILKGIQQIAKINDDVY